MPIDDRFSTQLLFDFASVSAPAGLVVASPETVFPSEIRPTSPSRSQSGLQAGVQVARRGPGTRVKRSVSKVPAVSGAPRPPRGIDHARPMQQRLDRIVAEVLAHHPLRVKRWRSSLSGLAVLRIYRDGREERTIESPYPTSPLRLAIFLHEVGHHVLGLGVHRPRCLEEYLAWRYAIDRLVELGIAVDGPVARRFERSMQYAVAKALRRGIRRLPVELLPFAPASVQDAVSAHAA